MNIVVQEEPYGCGIASVANIVGVSYADAKSKAVSMGISAEDDLLYSDTNYVRTLLKYYGFDTSLDETPFDSWDSLPDKSLLAINYREENGIPFWHWVVFSRANGNPVVMDSFMSIDVNERYDFKDIKPKWFIEVSRSHQRNN